MDQRAEQDRQRLSACGERATERELQAQRGDRDLQHLVAAERDARAEAWRRDGAASADHRPEQQPDDRGPDEWHQPAEPGGQRRRRRRTGGRRGRHGRSPGPVGAADGARRQPTGSGGGSAGRVAARGTSGRRSHALHTAARSWCSHQPAHTRSSRHVLPSSTNAVRPDRRRRRRRRRRHHPRRGLHRTDLRRRPAAAAHPRLPWAARVLRGRRAPRPRDASTSEWSPGIARPTARPAPSPRRPQPRAHDRRRTGIARDPGPRSGARLRWPLREDSPGRRRRARDRAHPSRLPRSRRLRRPDGAGR